MKRTLRLILAILAALLVGLVALGLVVPERIAMPPGTPGNFVDIDGAKIRYLQKGQGRDVLLIHGMPGTLEDWQPVFDRWASRFRVTAFDRAGQGYSDRPSGGTGIGYQARIAKRLMEILHLSNVIVVGHSYGGVVALALAADDDSPAKGFLVVSTSTFPAEQPLATLGKLLRLPLLGRSTAALVGIFGHRMVKEGIEAAFHPDEPMIPGGYIDARSKIFLQPKVTLTLAQDMEIYMQELGALAARYPSIKRPVLVVAGDQDKPRVVQGAIRLAHDARSVKLAMLKDAGHMLPFTRPDELTTLLDQLDHDSAPK